MVCFAGEDLDLADLGESIRVDEDFPQFLVQSQGTHAVGSDFVRGVEGGREFVDIRCDGCDDLVCRGADGQVDRQDLGVTVVGCANLAGVVDETDHDIVQISPVKSRHEQQVVVVFGESYAGPGSSSVKSPVQCLMRFLWVNRQQG